MIEDLPWLPRPPSGFSAHLRGLLPNDTSSLISAAQWALDAEQLRRLGQRLPAIVQDGRIGSIRLGLLTMGTSDILLAPLRATGLRHRLLIEPVTSDFGQVLHEALNPNSKFRSERFDVILASLTAEGIGLYEGNDSPEATIKQATDLIFSIIEGLSSNQGAQVLLETLAPPSFGPLGNGDMWIPSSLRYQVTRVNEAIRSFAAERHCAVLDVAALAEAVGLDTWHDRVMWHHAKLPFSLHRIPLYCDHLCRTLAGLRGLSRKVLVLDLDNTLWGGAVGDDGLEGIVLGNGSAMGEAYLSVQRMALELRKTGILLAAASKNDEATALAVFDNHPEMLIKREHLSAYAINWNEKSKNLAEMANSLNLGVESFVFLDDNPGERARMRADLPAVAVPEIGDDPAHYPRLLHAAGYFERQSLTREDLQRADFYTTERQRSSEREDFSSVGDYLSSLDMTLNCMPINAVDLTRATQLINKTNQFNLTTQRRTEDEVKALLNDPTAFTLTARLSDKFGDLGLIAVAICKGTEAGAWTIENLLMSCRVLNRGVEEAFISVIAAAAKSHGVTELIGRYLPTERNAMVATLFARLGFTQIDKLVDGQTVWQLAPDACPPPPQAIRIVCH